MITVHAIRPVSFAVPKTASTEPRPVSLGIGGAVDLEPNEYVATREVLESLRTKGYISYTDPSGNPQVGDNTISYGDCDAALKALIDAGGGGATGPTGPTGSGSTGATGATGAGGSTGSAVANATFTVIPPAQASGIFRAMMLPNPGDTASVIYNPGPFQHLELVTFVAGAPANANQSSLAGDAVQNLANTLAALFPLTTEAVITREGPSDVKVTVGSSFTGIASNDKITILSSNQMAVQIVGTSPMGGVQGGQTASNDYDKDSVGAQLNALLASLRTAGVIAT